MSRRRMMPFMKHSTILGCSQRTSKSTQIPYLLQIHRVFHSNPYIAHIYSGYHQPCFTKNPLTHCESVTHLVSVLIKLHVSGGLGMIKRLHLPDNAHTALLTPQLESRRVRELTRLRKYTYTRNAHSWLKTADRAISMKCYG
jgi:hypothetical protein